MNPYEIHNISPCADNDRLTLEGTFLEEVDIKILKKKLSKINISLTSLDNMDLIIIKSPDYDLYIYDRTRFVFSKLKSHEYAYSLLNFITEAE